MQTNSSQFDIHYEDEIKKICEPSIPESVSFNQVQIQVSSIDESLIHYKITE